MILKYNGKKNYIDPSNRFVLEPGDLVEFVDLEAAQILQTNTDFSPKKEGEPDGN